MRANDVVGRQRMGFMVKVLEFRKASLFGMVVAALAASPANAQMAKFSPRMANSIILIDVNGLHNSPLGRQNNWAEKHIEDYAAGRTPFPAKAQSVMFAREIDPGGWRTVRREVAILRSNEPIGFNRLAEVVGGKVQKIGNRSIVASPRGFLAALIDDKSAVGYYPADRQAFGRWLKDATQGEQAQLSPFLTRVMNSWPRFGQLVIALDMTEGVDQATILEELKMQKELVKDEGQARQLAQAFADIEGLRFTIAVSDKINAEWNIEFSDSIAGAERILRPFLENSVKRIGDSTFDLSTWTMTSSSKAVSFKSTLTPEQLYGVFESIHSPILNGQSLSPSTAPDPSQAAASQRYFRSVNNIVRSLDRFADNLADYNVAANEYDRSADRIQRMSTANVDPKVVEFGNGISTILFNMASVLRGVPREAAVQTATAWNERFFRGPSYYNPGWNYPWRWGVQPPVFVGGGSNPVDQARGNIARSMSDEANQRRNDWLKIRELQRTTSAKMTNKYGVDFKI
jgi:hypothetical protein